MSRQVGARPDRYRAVLWSLGFSGAGVAGWRESAACRGVDPEVFYPVGTGPRLAEELAAAKAVCAGCPVRAVCLADVMAIEDPGLRWGVVGGLAPAERARVFAEHRDQESRVGSGRAVA
jgi:hypothetical protein